MKFTVSQSSLTQAIGVVMKGVASASTLPILSGVLVKAQDGILEFQTSNYTISIRHRIAAHVEEEGEMVIPCKMLSNITKTLPDAPVTFELSERQVLIGCEKSSFRLNTLDANDSLPMPSRARWSFRPTSCPRWSAVYGASLRPIRPVPSWEACI